MGMQDWAEADTAPWTKVNENFDALDGAALYAHEKQSDSGVTFGYQGGTFKDAAKTSGTVALTNNATNYIVAALSGGAVTASTSTTNWNDSANYARLHKVVTSGGAITTVTDYRFDEDGLFALLAGGGGGGSSGSVTIISEASNGATHSLDPSEAGQMIRFTGTGTKTVAIDTADGYSSGQVFHVANRGASGNVAITIDTDGDLNPPKGGSLELEPGDTVTIHFVSTTEADVYGSTEPVS